MIVFNIFQDRFVCVKDDKVLFEIYVDDGGNKQMLRAFSNALGDLHNGELESTDAVEFEEA
jgi:hypothetical protein